MSLPLRHEKEAGGSDRQEAVVTRGQGPSGAERRGQLVRESKREETHTNAKVGDNSD